MENKQQSGVEAILARLGQRRDALLEKLSHALESDERIEAVWLSGSFGRGEVDVWSDLDLHVAVQDEYLQYFVEKPEALFELAGPPLLIQHINGESESMPGGFFWLVLYSGALEVDWNIGPVSKAVRPVASQLLFGRAGVSLASSPEPVRLEERQTHATKMLTFFWAMAPIAIKYVGRGHTALAVNQIGLLRTAYSGVWRALYRPEHLQSYRYHQNRRLEAELDTALPRLGPVITPASALQNIRAFCTAVEKLHPALAELGVAIPAAIVGEVAALAEQTESIAAQGGSRPYEGSRR
jgi:predicted nucleotidyltransferase